jgi:DNA invertase Pin-like site-specific DNA recombinase
MRIALYLRVSTDRQTTDSQAVELREYCAHRGWHNVKEFSDTSSGAKFSRRGLDALMRMFDAGASTLLSLTNWIDWGVHSRTLHN